MPEVVIEKAICESCGADVRENTFFCYNCGSRVAGDVEEPLKKDDGQPVESSEAQKEDSAHSNGTSTEAQAALEDLAKRFEIDPEEDGRLAKAAAQRKKARIKSRKAEYRWEPGGGPSEVVLLLIALVVTAITALVVFLTVYWK